MTPRTRRIVVLVALVAMLAAVAVAPLFWRAHPADSPSPDAPARILPDPGGRRRERGTNAEHGAARARAEAPRVVVRGAVVDRGVPGGGDGAAGQADAATRWSMQAVRASTSPGSTAGNMPTRIWLRPRLR